MPWITQEEKSVGVSLAHTRLFFFLEDEKREKLSFELDERRENILDRFELFVLE